MFLTWLFMIVYESPNVELKYHYTEKILEVRWIGELETEQFKVMWYKVIEAANTYGAENILLDATHVATTSTPAIYDSQVQMYFS